MLSIISCQVFADTLDIKRRYSDREIARFRPDLFTRDQIADMALVKPEEPEMHNIETRGQFIAHIESKLAQYQSLLKKVEQIQASDREGTKEKFKVERAKGGLEYDGFPPYVSYERDKAYLRKKIHRAKNKLSILRSCLDPQSPNKKKRCA